MLGQNKVKQSARAKELHKHTGRSVQQQIVEAVKATGACGSHEEGSQAWGDAVRERAKWWSLKQPAGERI